MGHDYMGGSGGGARRRRADRVGTVLAVLVGAAVLLTGCGAPSASPPSTAAEAYDVAHPSGPVPSTLKMVDLTQEQVAGRGAAPGGDAARILLPQHLPPGFRPAAPYIAVGDGTARPNPEGWGRSYRVSYTDGRGLLVVTCGATSLPDGVVWSGDRLRIDGRPARAGQAGGTIVVATDDGSPLIVVTGGRVARTLLLACAASLEPWH